MCKAVDSKFTQKDDGVDIFLAVCEVHVYDICGKWSFPTFELRSHGVGSVGKDSISSVAA